MSNDPRKIAPTAWLVGAMTAASALAMALCLAIGAPEDVIREPIARVDVSTPVGAAMETVPDEHRASPRTSVVPRIPFASDAAEAPPEESPEVRARRAAASLAASLNPAVFRTATFEIQARALAASLGPEETRELVLVAAGQGRAASEAIAAAEILRHAHAPNGPALPATALAALRSAWEGRADDPVLAAAAVRALGAFGDAVDRGAMITEVTERTPASIADLACAGLSAARGDEASAELAGAFDENRDPRQSEIVLSALTAIASAEDGGLSDAARSRCTETLLRALESQPREDRARRDRPTRILAALAALDPELARAPLLAVLSDATAGPATTQSAASALATIPAAEPELLAMLRDDRLDESRRELAAEALLRRDSDPLGEARSVLERARDGRSGTPQERRAARVLERVDASSTRR